MTRPSKSLHMTEKNVKHIPPIKLLTVLRFKQDIVLYAGGMMSFYSNNDYLMFS